MTKRRKFTPEFKVQVVLEELTGLKTKAEVSREYRPGVSTHSLAIRTGWRG